MIRQVKKDDRINDSERHDEEQLIRWKDELDQFTTEFFMSRKFRLE